MSSERAATVRRPDRGGAGPAAGRAAPPSTKVRRSPRQRAVYRRRRLFVSGLLVVVLVLATWHPSTVARRAEASLGPIVRALRAPSTTARLLSRDLTLAAAVSPLRGRIVAIAESQVGYQTDPPGTYCNKFSAYWVSGTNDCGNGNLDEQWCADFAAWVWQKAGAPVVYQYINGDLNSSSASFYEWGEARGTWHATGTGYAPQPGDVAIYGLDAGTLVAQHVAIVIGASAGDKGPDTINGDGDHSAFSIVEVGLDQVQADVPGGSPALLSGYVSPG
jgi:hypothetical protein